MNTTINAIIEKSVSTKDSHRVFLLIKDRFEHLIMVYKNLEKDYQKVKQELSLQEKTVKNILNNMSKNETTSFNIETYKSVVNDFNELFRRLSNLDPTIKTHRQILYNSYNLLNNALS